MELYIGKNANGKIKPKKKNELSIIKEISRRQKQNKTHCKVI